MTTIRVPVSVGELLDKVTILELKLRHIADPAKRANVAAEHAALEAIMAPLLQGAAPAVLAALERLREVNAALWRTEDEIRDCERRGEFGPAFVALARSVYVTNDERARLKRELSLLLGSELVEEKSYTDYARPPA